MKCRSALGLHIIKRLEELEKADFVLGIPCFNNDRTTEHVIKMVSHGLRDSFPSLWAVMVVTDGGSTDDSGNVAREFQFKPWQEQFVGIYRDTQGKGSAL